MYRSKSVLLKAMPVGIRIFQEKWCALILVNLKPFIENVEISELSGSPVQNDLPISCRLEIPFAANTLHKVARANVRRRSLPAIITSIC